MSHSTVITNIELRIIGINVRISAELYFWVL